MRDIENMNSLRFGHKNLPKISFGQIQGTSDSQQDFYVHLANELMTLQVVADGIGGMYCGGDTSKIVVDIFAKDFTEFSVNFLNSTASA